MESTVAERIKNIREAKRFTQKQMGEEIGLKQGSYSSLESGKSELSSSVRKLLIDNLYVNPEYIDSGLEPMFIKKDDGKNVSNGKQILGIQKDNCYIVPVKAFGGFLNGYESKVYMDSIQKTSFPFIRGECFMFEIEGYSMIKAGDPDGSFLPGNWVVCTAIDDFNELRSHKVYVFQTIDGIIIKEYNKMESDCAHLISYSGEPVTPIHLKSIKRVYFVDYKLNKP